MKHMYVTAATKNMLAKKITPFRRLKNPLSSGGAEKRGEFALLARLYRASLSISGPITLVSPLYPLQLKTEADPVFETLRDFS